jgi:hypothetical protein
MSYTGVLQGVDVSRAPCDHWSPRRVLFMWEYRVLHQTIIATPITSQRDRRGAEGSRKVNQEG